MPLGCQGPKGRVLSKVVPAEVTLASWMPPRALASALAMVLEDLDVFTVGDFADFLDGIDGVEGAAKTFAHRIRSDELAVAVRATNHRHSETIVVTSWFCKIFSRQANITGYLRS